MSLENSTVYFFEVTTFESHCSLVVFCMTGSMVCVVLGRFVIKLLMVGIS